MKREREKSTSEEKGESSESDNDDYFGIFGDEPEKGEVLLAILLCQMTYQQIDETTKLELETIKKANNIATSRAAAIMMSSSSLSLPPANISDERLKPSRFDKKLYEMRYFKKAKLGYGVDEVELPALPPVERLKGIVGCCSKPFEKVLTPSDLNGGLSRLALVKKYTSNTIFPLLTEDQNTILNTTSRGFDVTIYDQDGNTYSMFLKNWASDKMYILGGVGWKKFYEDHHLLDKEDWVSIWSFRHLKTRKLCFAITSRWFHIDRYYKHRR